MSGLPGEQLQPRENGLCAPEDEEHWEQLARDVQDRRCALFVGSGCSNPDYGTWRQMVDKIAADAKKNVPAGLEPKEYPAFLGLCRKDMGEPAYKAALESILSPAGKELFRPVHAAMIHTAFVSFVTTNYDSSLENADCLEPQVLPSGSVVSYPHDRLQPTKLRSRSVFHVHGRAYDGNGTCLLPDIVVTDEDLQSAYQRPDVTNTLSFLLSDLCVLFVGFSSEDGTLERVVKKHLGPYEDSLLQNPNPPRQTGAEVRYYVLRDVCIQNWRVRVAAGEETAPTEMPGVDRRKWNAARVEAVDWFQHPPWDLGGRVRPIVYARRKDDKLHAKLTSLMTDLQRMPGCTAGTPGGA